MRGRPYLPVDLKCPTCGKTGQAKIFIGTEQPRAEVAKEFKLSQDTNNIVKISCASCGTDVCQLS